MGLDGFGLRKELAFPKKEENTEEQGACHAHGFHRSSAWVPVGVEAVERDVVLAKEAFGLKGKDHCKWDFGLLTLWEFLIPDPNVACQESLGPFMIGGSVEMVVDTVDCEVFRDTW